MPDYKRMYFDLFNSITDATRILCEAQQRAEELYINSQKNEEETKNPIKR